MKADELFKLTEDEWDKLTDAELYTILSPYFQVTRPEFGKVATPDKKKSMDNKGGKVRQNNISAEIASLMAKLNLTPPTKPTQ